MFREFFYLHKGERRIILALLLVAAIAIGVIMLAGGRDEAEGQSALISADSIAKNIGSALNDSMSNVPYYQQPTKAAERFAFDPNTADSTMLLRLGLQPWQVRNIYKYRAAGGIYRKKEDFARLYGLTVKQYRELEPYIHISAEYQPAATLFEERRDTSVTPTPTYPSKLAAGETIDLATADTTQLRTVPGIGPYYARRIVDYGNQLGGYISLSQLDEIDGFPSDAKSFFTLSTTTPRRMNINALSLNELRRHPYINFYQARAIVDYRRQYGPIADLHDLHLLPDFPPEAIERLLPYVEY